MNQIKKARVMAGLTQTELAERLGVSHVSVCKWENDHAFPRPGRLKAIADVLNTTVESLMEGKIA